jgi:hypothetical protein
LEARHGEDDHHPHGFVGVERVHDGGADGLGREHGGSIAGRESRGAGDAIRIERAVRQ